MGSLTGWVDDAAFFAIWLLPDELDFTSGAITISTLAGLNQTVSDIEQLETLDNDWVYPSLKRSQDFLVSYSTCRIIFKYDTRN